MKDACNTPETLSLDGNVMRVTFRSEKTGYCVLRVAIAAKGEVTVVGTCATVWEGEELHAEGTWVEDVTHGRQFKAKSITCITPKSVEGIKRYLASGLIKGIGPVYAAKIVEHFGTETINVLDYQSARLAEVRGIAKTRIAIIRDAWKAGRTMREVMIFTQTHGISVSQTARIYRCYGPDAIAIIKKDPYRLCHDVWGIGFATADRIALSVGFPQDAPERARAAIIHTLRTQAEQGGHCWTSESDLLLHAEELVGVSIEKLADSVQKELAAGRIVWENDRIYLAEFRRAERRAAARLSNILNAPRTFAPINAEKAIAWWEKKAGFTLAPAQFNAVKASLDAKASIITGGPGVGKTTIIRVLVEIWRARHLLVRLAAPTGRAAKRMSESVYSGDIPPDAFPAVTLHRLLKYNPQTNAFSYHEAHPLEGDIFIFDECSMVDIQLLADLVAALPNTATVVFVGDTDQLPSVGPGNVLGDLINSGMMASSRLTEIFRQDNFGLIVRNAHRVNEGQMFETSSGESDFYFIAKEDPAEVLALALDFMTTRIPRHFGMNPLRDVQVLTPMRRNSLGAENLNVQLQARLNPTGDAITRGSVVFRTGDRVMQLRNNYDKDVYNGDVGFILKANSDERELIVDFDGRPVEYKSADLDELTLAYATTIHKSQGSEYPAVIVLMHTQHFVMLQRNLLYTAITRGKKLVLVIGAPYAIKKAVETNVVRERRTSLAARLQYGGSVTPPPDSTKN